jgi:hypothetical protein
VHFLYFPLRASLLISNNTPTMTALIPIYIHLFGFTLPDAFRCLLYTPSSGASTCFHSHGYYDPLQHRACTCFPGCFIVVTCTPIVIFTNHLYLKLVNNFFTNHLYLKLFNKFFTNHLYLNILTTFSLIIYI